MGWNDDTSDENDSEEVEGDVDLSQLAPSAMDVSDAAEKDHVWKIMWWGNEGVGKSHACYTMPEPVCFIDTENKADDIAHKFSDEEVHIWQPSDFEEATTYRDEALSFLSEYEAQTGQKGTLVVDTMADMWDWSKNQYINKYYNNTDPEDVNLSLEDWAPIKKIHNESFRRDIENCGFHVSWTATRKDDVGTAVENELEVTPDKPGGETNNPYKVNSIIRLELGDGGVPVGNLQKSGILRFKYLGLRRPTFEKHKEIVNHVEQIEADGAESAQDVVDEYELDYEVSFTEANTMRFINQ